MSRMYGNIRACGVWVSLYEDLKIFSRPVWLESSSEDVVILCCRKGLV